VLNFLAAHSGAFTLSELAAQVGINISSLHSVLALLEREGYVARDPRRKTYRLGLAPIAVGQAALDHHVAIDAARLATAELAAELGLEALCAVAAGSDLLIVAEAGDPERLWMRPRVGSRLPLMPPLGILAAAHLDGAAVEAWLDRLGPDASAADRDAYRRAARVARVHGYQLELETPTRKQIGLLMPELARGRRSEALEARIRELIARLGHERHTLTDPKPSETYQLNNVHAPVFDAYARPVAWITLLGFDAPLSGARIEEIARTLTSTTERVTRASGGRLPVPL
jgi:DNA-binding IclR family transcriptional regulator